jgi:hypothetical protein
LSGSKHSSRQKHLIFTVGSRKRQLFLGRVRAEASAVVFASSAPPLLLTLEFGRRRPNAYIRTVPDSSTTSSLFLCTDAVSGLPVSSPACVFDIKLTEPTKKKRQLSSAEFPSCYMSRTIHCSSFIFVPRLILEVCIWCGESVS